MSKFLYPIYKLPNEYKQDLDVREVPLYIKWWLFNHYKKTHSWIISEIITGNPLTLEDSVQAKFPMPPLPRGNSEQVQYSGKNKLDFDYLVSHKLDFLKDGKYFAFLELDSSFKTQFTVSTILKGTSQNLVMGFSDVVFSAGNTEYRTLNNETITSPKTFDFTNADKVYVFIGNSSTLSSGLTEIDSLYNNYNVQLEEGSTATAYEPYVGGTASPNPLYPQPITNVTGDVEVLVQNKNLYNEATIIMDSWMSATGNVGYTDGAIITDYIKVKGNIAYVFLSINNSTVRTFYTVNQFDKNYNWIKGQEIGINAGNNLNQIITMENNCAFIKFSIRSFNTSSNIQIEQGTTATPYVPHKEQTYTFPLGTQTMYLGDYLADDGIHNKRNQYVLQGEDIASLNSQGSTYFSVTVNKFASIISKESATDILCNMLKSSSSTVANSLRIVTSSGNIILIFATDFADYNLTAVRTKIQSLYDNGTPLILEIPLAEEVITPYTEPQQQAYNEIKQAISYEEQTNISGSSDESNPIFSVQYYKKKTEENQNTLSLNRDNNFIENTENLLDVNELEESEELNHETNS